jgi:hypothetical protein
MAMPIPARNETAISGSTTGVMLLKRSPTDASSWPSCTSRTSWTTMPVKNVLTTMLRIAPIGPRTSTRIASTANTTKAAPSSTTAWFL